MAVIIGDDTGHNGLFFGDADDANYYVEVDMYCHDRSAQSLAYEVAGLAARAGRDTNGTTEPLHEPIDYTYNVDRAGSYCLFYNYFKKEVRAVKWTHGNSVSTIKNDDLSSPTSFTQYGNTVENITAGWHTFRIDCLGDDITFTFDGTEVASITDSSETKYPFGRPALYYREDQTSPEYQAYFDNLKAGPTAQAKVSDWTLY